LEGLLASEPLPEDIDELPPVERNDLGIPNQFLQRTILVAHSENEEYAADCSHDLPTI
jgi:hypothetical protein